jgi:hypothetical protein
LKRPSDLPVLHSAGVREIIEKAAERMRVIEIF